MIGGCEVQEVEIVQKMQPWKLIWRLKVSRKMYYEVLSCIFCFTGLLLDKFVLSPHSVISMQRKMHYNFLAVKCSGLSGPREEEPTAV